VGPCYLLWTLYSSSSTAMRGVNVAFCQCDEKTFHKWHWMVMKALADLDLVSESVPVFACYSPICFLTMSFHHILFSHFCPYLRLIQDCLGGQVHMADNGSKCLVSADGTDYTTRGKTSPFHRKWFAHKMNGPGLRDASKKVCWFGPMCPTPNPW
jgi:hypothetical protein